ncbi:MAG: hypothetical protein AAF688_03360 [Bacteroidota bacterium]
MMNKKSILSVLLIAAFMVSCGDDNNQTSNNQEDYYLNDQSFSNQNQDGNLNQYQGQQNDFGRKQNNNSNKKPLPLKVLSNGMTESVLMIPISWQQENRNDAILAEGPNGIKMFRTIVNSFTASDDPMVREWMNKNGTAYKPVATAKQFINGDLKTIIEKGGNRLVSVNFSPVLTKKAKQTEDLFWKANPEQGKNEVYITEWEDNEGNKSVMVVNHYIVRGSQNFTSWGYSLRALDAEKAVYPRAKNDFLFALANEQINRQYVQVINSQRQKQLADQRKHNNQLQQNLNSQWQSHQAYNRSQQKVRQDSWDSYYYREGVMDKTSDQFNNAITGQTNVYDPNTGEGYKIDDTNQYYYTNGDGEYIGTNDPNFNMNGEYDTGSTTWEEMKVEN